MHSDALVLHGGGGHSPSTPRRVLALGMLGLILVGGAVGATRGSARTVDPELRAPIPVDSVAGNLVSGGSWHARDLSGPSILLYVDEECPWCKEELLTWHELVRATGSTAPVVILSRRSAPGFVPPSLARFLVHDQTGSIARALGLRGVPATAIVTPRGVTHLFYGLSGQSRLDSLLHLLDVPSPHSSPSPEGAIR